MPKYTEDSEAFKLRKAIANMFFEDGKALSLGDMMNYEPAKEMLSRLFELERRDKTVARRHYLQNLRAWASKTLIAKDTSVESENTITIKKVKTQKVCKIRLSPVKIDSQGEYIENTDQTTQTSYETSRITKIEFKSELGRETEKTLVESIKYIKDYKNAFVDNFEKEDKGIKDKIKKWEDLVNASEKNINTLKEDINSKLAYFKEQLRAVYANESYDFDEKFKTAKQSYEMILKVYDNELRQHEILIKKHESFIRNISTHQDWKEKGLRQMQIYEDMLFKIQQTYSGIIANDMKLVEGGFVQKDVSKNTGETNSIENITNIIDSIKPKEVE